jgi:hypothetical protein
MKERKKKGRTKGKRNKENETRSGRKKHELTFVYFKHFNTERAALS